MNQKHDIYVVYMKLTYKGAHRLTVNGWRNTYYPNTNFFLIILSKKKELLY